MDSLGNSNLDFDKPIPLDEDLTKPIPLDGTPQGGSPGVSRAPLNLGGGPAPARAPASKPIVKRPAQTTGTVSNARITGVKTFFTKLHPGALEFLDEQITKWLKDNPDVHIKHTNLTTGQVQAKKTEPNIIITVWY